MPYTFVCANPYCPYNGYTSVALSDCDKCKQDAERAKREKKPETYIDKHAENQKAYDRRKKNK